MTDRFNSEKNFERNNRSSASSNRENGGRRHFNRSSDSDNSESRRPRKRIEFKPKSASYGRSNDSRYNNTDKPNVKFRKRKNTSGGSYESHSRDQKQFPNRRNDIGEPVYTRAYNDPTKPIRLNKFLANAGICSRREADTYISAGVILVNDKIVSELGAKVLPTDKILFHNQPVRLEQKTYILLNKPKNTVTTVEDTHDRKTVMDIVRNACCERVYPVGRLDRNTTGVLLITNDGELTTKLTHPKHNMKKIYHVGLDRDLEMEDAEKILGGIDLGDFVIHADELEYIKDDNKREIGLEIHSGQNRVVRRIFDALGYKVMKLDRVYFAGLTKKNVPRGKYRFLNRTEINMLKMGAYE